MSFRDSCNDVQSSINEEGIRWGPEEVSVNRSDVAGEEVSFLNRLHANLRPEALGPVVLFDEMLLGRRVDPYRRVVPTEPRPPAGAELPEQLPDGSALRNRGQNKSTPKPQPTYFQCSTVSHPTNKPPILQFTSIVSVVLPTS